MIFVTIKRIAHQNVIIILYIVQSLVLGTTWRGKLTNTDAKLEHH